jgi:heat shock protein HspQ
LIRHSTIPRNGGSRSRRKSGPKDQPFYHLLAENEETEYIAYVSEQNLLVDDAGSPVRHPQIPEFFETYDPDKHAYLPRHSAAH